MSFVSVEVLFSKLAAAGATISALNEEARDRDAELAATRDLLIEVRSDLAEAIELLKDIEQDGFSNDLGCPKCGWAEGEHYHGCELDKFLRRMR